MLFQSARLSVGDCSIVRRPSRSPRPLWVIPDIGGQVSGSPTLPLRRNVMEALLGFSLDFWDYATFLSLFFLPSSDSDSLCSCLVFRDESPSPETTQKQRRFI